MVNLHYSPVLLLALLAPLAVCTPPSESDVNTGKVEPQASSPRLLDLKERSFMGVRSGKRTLVSLHMPRYMRHKRWGSRAVSHLPSMNRQELAVDTAPEPITYNIFPFETGEAVTVKPTPTLASSEDGPAPSADQVGSTLDQGILAPFAGEDRPSSHKIATIAGVGGIIGFVFFMVLAKLTFNALRKPKVKSTGAIEWRMSFAGRPDCDKQAREGEKVSSASTESFHTATSTHTKGEASAAPDLKKFDIFPSSPSLAAVNKSSPHELLVVTFDPPCAPAPTFPPPSPPKPLVPIRYAELLSPTANLAAHNQASARLSAASLDSSIYGMTMGLGLSPHKRTRSVPESMPGGPAAVSDDGYWDMLDLLSRPDSAGERSMRLSQSTRSSRGRSEEEALVSNPAF